MAYEKVPDQTGQNFPVSTQYATFPGASGNAFVAPQYDTFPSGSGAPVTPLTLYGASVAAWYRGDVRVVTGSGVSEWTDQSGNTRHVVQATDAARPPIVDPDALFGGRATVNPDGSADFLQSSAAASTWKFLHDGTGCTVLAIVRPANGFVNSRVILDTCNATSANVGIVIFRSGTTDSNGVLNVQVSAGGGTNAILHATGAGTFNNNATHIVCFSYEEGRAGAEWILRLNRAATASGNSTASPSASNPAFTLAVARMASTSALFFGGKTPENVLLNRALNTAEMQQFEAYVLDYYGI